MTFLKKRIGKTHAGFGETLRELRELRGYTREELARRCGIHPLILAALEEERLEDLADPMYAERHVNALALALEGRPAYVMGKYRHLLNARGFSRSHAIFPRPRVMRRDLFVGPRAIAFGSFLLFAICLVGYVAWQARIVSSFPRLTVRTPRDGMQLETPRVAVSGATDPGARVSVNGIPAVVNPDGVFFLSLDVPRGVSIIRVEARRRYSDAIAIERRVTYALPVNAQNLHPPL